MALPKAIRESETVAAWWRGLAAPVRASLARSWDERKETVAARSVPIEFFASLARPSVADELDDELAFSQLYEYVIGNPDITFFLEERHFHICRAHASARRIIRHGVVPAGFACPAAAASCPFAVMSHHVGGCEVHLRARVQWDNCRDVTATSGTNVP